MFKRVLSPQHPRFSRTGGGGTQTRPPTFIIKEGEGYGGWWKLRYWWGAETDFSHLVEYLLRRLSHVIHTVIITPTLCKHSNKKFLYSLLIVLKWLQCTSSSLTWRFCASKDCRTMTWTVIAITGPHCKFIFCIWLQLIYHSLPLGSSYHSSFHGRCIWRGLVLVNNIAYDDSLWVLGRTPGNKDRAAVEGTCTRVHCTFAKRS